MVAGSSRRSRAHDRGFTLLELLTVCSIIGLLASLCMPQFLKAFDKARLTGCQTNLKNIATALQVYANDNEGQYPGALSALTPSYLKAIPTCPSAVKDSYSELYTRAVDPANFTVFCAGVNHSTCDLGTDEPFFEFKDGLGPVSP